MAARSMVNTAVMRAGIPGSPLAASVILIWQVIASDIIGKPRRCAVELQGHFADRTVTLLCDDDFAGAMDLLEPFLPIRIALVEFLFALLGAPAGLGATEIVFLAIDEHDDVGVLLDRARLAQIREHGPFV